MSYPTLVIENFSRGLNTTEPPSDLDSDTNWFLLLREDSKHIVKDVDCQFPVMRNLTARYRGRLQKRNGQHTLIPTLAGNGQGFTRFRDTNYNTYYMIVYQGVLYAYDETTLDVTTVYSGLDATAQISFVAYNGWLLVTDGITPPVMWNGSITPAVPVGLSAPANAPGVAPVLALSGTNIWPVPNFTGITFYPHEYQNGDTDIGLTFTGPNMDFWSAGSRGYQNVMPANFSTFTVNWAYLDNPGSGFKTTATTSNQTISSMVYYRQFQITAQYWTASVLGNYGLKLVVQTYSDDPGTALIETKEVQIQAPYYDGSTVTQAQLPTIQTILDFTSSVSEIKSIRVGIYASSNNVVGGGFYITNVNVVPLEASTGNLYSLGTGDVPYQWFYTYYSSTYNLESNPSPSSGAFNLDYQSAEVAWNASTDVLADKVNIYRFGGTSSQFRLQGTYDMATGVITDNTADVDLSLTLMTYTHSGPVTGIGFWAAQPARERIFAAGDAAHPCRLYFSTFGTPWYFPTTVSDLLNDGGFADIDEDYLNPIIGFAGLGSFVLVFRKNDVYLFEGDSLNNIKIRKVSSKGCISRLSIVRAENMVLWMAPDGMVYGLAGDSPEPFALKIEKSLKVLTVAQLSTCCAAYYDQLYVVSFPDTPNALSYCYDFRPDVQSWSELSDLTFGASQFEVSSDIYPELLFMTRAGYTDEYGNPYNGLVSSLTNQDPNFPYFVDWASPQFEFGRQAFTKKAKSIRIMGTLSQTIGTDPVMATISAISPGQDTVSASFPLNLVAGPDPGLLLYMELPAILVARRLQIEISGLVTAFEIQDIQFSWSYIRIDRFN